MKIKRQVFHRKAAKDAEMIDLFFFAAETPAKKNTHALQAGPVTYKEPTRSVSSFPFLAPHQKREKYIPRCSLRLETPQVSAGTGGDI
jgi:hypothetical protein